MKQHGSANSDVYLSDVSLMGTSPTERFKWTKEKIAEFRDLYAQGLSHGELGNFFGITRNASIGKAHRLGLVSRAPKKQPKPLEAAGVHERTWQRWQAKARQQTSSGNEPVYHRNRCAPGHVFQPVSIGRDAIDLKPESIADAVTFMKLESHHCRWPVDRDGEPMMYCGADNILGLPYCSSHCRMAYVASQSRFRPYVSNRGGRAA